MSNLVFFIESKEECICNECGHRLKYRDKVLRIQRYRDNEPKWFVINRLKCTNESCGKLHRQLPDEMIEFKHYSSEDIEDVIDEVIDENDVEMTPCEATIKHWRWWFQFNKDQMERQLHSVVYRFFDQGFGLSDSKDSLLEEIRKRISPGWLGMCYRIINNSGGIIRTSPDDKRYAPTSV